MLGGVETASKGGDAEANGGESSPVEKAKDELGFEVEESLENGLKQVIDWKLS